MTRRFLVEVEVLRVEFPGEGDDVVLLARSRCGDATTWPTAKSSRNSSFFICQWLLGWKGGKRPAASGRAGRPIKTKTSP